MNMLVVSELEDSEEAELEPEPMELELLELTELMKSEETFKVEWDVPCFLEALPPNVFEWTLTS